MGHSAWLFTPFFCSFPAKKYKKVTGKEIYSDTLESTPMLEKEKFPQDYFPEVRPGGFSGHRLPEHLLFRVVTWEGDLRACLWVDSPSAAAPLYCSLPGRVGDSLG